MRVLSSVFGSPRLRAAVLALGVAAGLSAQAEETAGGSEKLVPAPESTNNVSPEKYVSIANESLADMRGALTRGLDELREAREAKDAVRITCVNVQVTAMKGLLRVSEVALVSLQEAETNKDSQQASYQFRKVQAGKRKMDSLLTDAANCAGAESTSSSAETTMDIDASAFAVDPYYGNGEFFFDPTDAVVNGGSGGLPSQDKPEVRPPNTSGVT